MQTHKFGPICFVSVVFLFHVINAKFLCNVAWLQWLLC